MGVAVALIIAVAIIAGLVQQRSDEKKAALEAQRAEERRIAEEKRAAEEAERKRIADEQRVKLEQEREAKRAALEEELRLKREADLKAYNKEVAEIASVPVVVSDTPAEKLPLAIADEVKYSTITTRTALAGLGNFVVIDVETTGLRPAQNEVVDVAAIRFRDFEPVEKFESLCFPKRGISEEAAGINGITSEMVEGKPTFQQIAASLQDFIGADNLVGHNLPFDLGFIVKYGVDVSARKRKYYDTLDLARKTLKKDTYRKRYDRELDYYEDVPVSGDVRDHKLETLCRYYGILNPESHRAFGDALAAGKLFQKLVEVRT